MDTLNEFGKHVQQELLKICIDAQSHSDKHNHPPLPFIVDDCIYCTCHGNVFANNNTTSVG